jgi:hypothetical protein
MCLHHAHRDRQWRVLPFAGPAELFVIHRDGMCNHDSAVTLMFLEERVNRAQ